MLLTPQSSDWRKALGGLRHDFYHLPEYLEIEARDGSEPRAFVHRSGDLVFFLPFLVRSIAGTDRRDACSPYGYPGPLTNALGDSLNSRFVEEAVRGFVAELDSLGVVSVFIRCHPLLPFPLEPLRALGTVVCEGPTVTVDLTLSESEYRARLRPTHRRHINRARREGFETRLDDWGQLDAFVESYWDAMDRLGAAKRYFFSREYFEGLRRLRDSGTHLFTVHSEGRLACGGLFFEAGDIIQYHLGATEPDFLGRQPSKLMFDEVCRWGRRHDCATLHLGGGLGSREDSLFHFKAGFSKDRSSFHTWRLVLDSDAYSTLTLEVDPSANVSDATGFFPAYRRPR